MLHFDAPWHNDRKPPKPGETVWVLPIRYWEPETFAPEAVDVTSVDERHIVGVHRAEHRETCFELRDAAWYRTEKGAREAQGLLAALHRLISREEGNALADHVLRTLAPHIPLPERD